MKNLHYFMILFALLLVPTIFAANQGPAVYIYLGDDTRNFYVDTSDSNLVWAALWNFDGQSDASVDQCQIDWSDGAGWEAVPIGTEGSYSYQNHTYTTTGTKTVYYKCRNTAGFWATPISDTMTITNAAPTLGSISLTPSPVPGGFTINITPNVPHDKNFDDLNFYCSDNSVPTFANTICTSGVLIDSYPYDNLLCQFSAPDDDTTHTVYCRLYDGTAYSPARAYVYETNTSPTGLSISIFDGAPSTTTAFVNLRLEAFNAFECRFQNQDVGSGNLSLWSAWELYTTSKQNWNIVWGIPFNNGLKRVNYQCRSTFGENSLVASDTILLAADPPIPEFSAVGMMVAILGALGMFVFFRRR